ncbi:hypothetical protein AB0A05_27735 [Streptomyces sp. NPDC046374]|uniref:hypothetical protein n=1 Tax=Streptomyces sp. NPDC046374 TaxID=3154917 RepID=UPI0033D8BE0A
MSQGLVFPSIAEIVPTVGYPASATPGTVDFASLTDAGQSAGHAVDGLGQGFGHAADGLGQGVGHAVDGLGQGVGHAVDGAQAAASHALDAAGHALQELLEPAAVALGALSGALLVCRAAMAGTRVLAAAAGRAAEEQRCLERVQRAATAATAQWEAAAFAAVRANARRAALLTRVRRAAVHTAPDTPPPPPPDLPPPLTCVGTRLDVLRRELAVLEEALTTAEAAQDRWTLAQTLHLTGGPADEAWRRRTQERREALVQALQDPSTADTAALPQAPAVEGLGRERAEESGAELLARLAPGADGKDAELAVAAVRLAVACADDRPAKARNHLREARQFVRDANRAVRSRLAAREKAAVQLDCLLTQAPPGEPPLAPAGEEIAILRAALEKGRAPTPEEQRAVDQRIRERTADLECRYTTELIGLAVARLADPDAARLPTARGGTAADGDGTAGAASDGSDGPLCFDLTPAGWWPDHWLRITVRDDATEMVTMHTERPGPSGAAQQALDARRCHEARGHLDELREAGRRWGIDLPVTFRESGAAVPGVRGGDGAIVLDLADARERTEPDTAARDDRRTSEQPKARHVDDDRRTTRR